MTSIQKLLERFRKQKETTNLFTMRSCIDPTVSVNCERQNGENMYEKYPQDNFQIRNNITTNPKNCRHKNNGTLKRCKV